MAMSPRARIIAIVAGCAALALLIGVGAGWLIRSTAADRPPENATGADDSTADEELTVDPASEQANQEESEGDTPGGEEPPGQAETVPSGPTERQPGLIVGVTGSPENWVMRVDYVQWLTGDEAAAAAAARGDESPPPNDYYVVNDNPRIREFPIQPGIQVFVVTNPDGTSDSAGHMITLADWVAELSGPSADAFKASIYWVTITNGTVTAIEAQYVP